MKERNMRQNKSNRIRSFFVAAAVIILTVTMLISTESVSAASRLRVTPTKKTIYVGKSIRLKANKKVKWSVSKRKVAKLTKIGKRTVTVKGLKAGTVYVTAKAGKVRRKVKITVKAKKKISLTASKTAIGLGEYCKVLVKCGKSIGENSSYTFSSSDKSIAYVDSGGLVQGLKEGAATITAKAKSDKTVKASIRINVIDAKAGTITLSVDLSDEERYPAGKSAKV